MSILPMTEAKFAEHIWSEGRSIFLKQTPKHPATLPDPAYEFWLSKMTLEDRKEHWTKARDAFPPFPALCFDEVIKFLEGILKSNLEKISERPPSHLGGKR